MKKIIFKKVFKNIRYWLKVLWYHIEVLWAKILLKLGIEKSIDPIPGNTSYCYTWNEERNEKEPIDGYWIKPCKYYRSMKGSNAGCTFVGFIGFEPCLGDQCKICGVKDYEWKEEEELSK